jgi:SAM-dependent methyltransferase
MGALLVADEALLWAAASSPTPKKLFTMKVKSDRFQSPLLSLRMNPVYAFKEPLNLFPPEDVDYVKIDFKETGSRFAGYWHGCGLGPLAAALTGYLDSTARYEGIDVVSSGIAWCEEEITSRVPNFHFRLADVQNNNTNRERRIPGSAYSFPYKNESFDLVFMRSVFTQMPAPDFERYVGEVARVLAPDGRFLGTFFLLNDESIHLMETAQQAPISVCPRRLPYHRARHMWRACLR